LIIGPTQNDAAITNCTRRDKIQIFRNATLCKLVKSYLQSEGVYSLHLQGQAVKEERWTTWPWRCL